MGSWICVTCFVTIFVSFTLFRLKNSCQNGLGISLVSPNFIRGYIYVTPTESWGFVLEFGVTWVICLRFMSTSSVRLTVGWDGL